MVYCLVIKPDFGNRDLKMVQTEEIKQRREADAEKRRPFYVG
jgi:hypothetical protein